MRWDCSDIGSVRAAAGIPTVVAPGVQPQIVNPGFPPAAAPGTNPFVPPSTPAPEYTPPHPVAVAESRARIGS